MDKSLTFQEIAIAIAADKLNPTVINPDFLKYSGIVPEDWELARPAVYTNQVVQIVFQSGVAIVAQPGRLVFVEVVEGKTPSTLQVVDLADRCIEKLPNIEYQAIGINPKIHATFDQPDGARRYFTEQLLAPGAWQQFGQAEMQASVQLAYTLERCQLNLVLNEAILQRPEQQPQPVVLFSGNFNYTLTEENREQRLQMARQRIKGWQVDLKTFAELITTQFLQQQFGAIAS